MEIQEPKWVGLYKGNGVSMGEYTPEYGKSWLAVADEDYKHYRLRFYSTDEGNVSVGVDAEWDDFHPGDMANFTNEIHADCGPNDTLSIADDGLLTVLARKLSASSVDFRTGFTLQLPSAFVPAVRKAIRLARARALMATGAISAERFRELENEA